MTDGEKLNRIKQIIDDAEHRSMFGAVVSNTREEMTDDELREIYKLAGGKIRKVSLETRQKQRESRLTFLERKRRENVAGQGCDTRSPLDR